MSFKMTATKAMVKGLADFLKENMPSVKSAYYNWPNPNEKLVYPSVSVFARSPIFTPLSPYTIHKGPLDEVTDKVAVRRVIGMYDFSLQVDLWSSYKAQREQLHEELIQALSKDYNVVGLSLQLADYYDEWARFDLETVDFVDDEQASQRNEWRINARVLANCKVVREHLANVMETIENNLEIQDEIVPPEEEDSGAIV